eukprot:CAMPEP_0182445512 /NCGR_PEP_ID=MMETSP1172-20130603/3611_1 /TAXON_ID=708627 /ORGANISM="Timspurckia oligopyrenoides, Strain CCMP3278" /LENGTH=536 /DNA_ID=CAMNT_0024641301 /DNA_START=93 /DNA_END=1703 /DNA_ORIENTATION=-
MSPHEEYADSCQNRILYLRECAGDLYETDDLQERWSLGACIGKGGMGAVHIANRVGKRNLVAAVKIISKDVVMHAVDKMRMLLSEVTCLRRVHEVPTHPNIVDVFEICEDESNVYIVQEMLRGGELFSLLACSGTVFPERDCVVMLRSLVSAVDFLHSRGIHHRDIKPENVMFKKGADVSRAKLIDFGVSFHISQANLLSRVPVGSPMYLAPEVLCGEPYTFAADIWSLGIIAFVCLTGALPYDLNLCDSLLDTVLEFGPSFDLKEFKALSNEAQSFVKSLLAWEKHKRPTASELMDHEWLARYKQVVPISDAFKAKFHNGIQPVVEMYGSLNQSHESSVVHPEMALAPGYMNEEQLTFGLPSKTNSRVKSEDIELISQDSPESILRSSSEKDEVAEEEESRLIAQGGILYASRSLGPDPLFSSDDEDEDKGDDESVDGWNDFYDEVHDMNETSTKKSSRDASTNFSPNIALLKKLGSNTNLWSTRIMPQRQFDIDILTLPPTPLSPVPETEKQLSKIFRVVNIKDVNLKWFDSEN